MPANGVWGAVRRIVFRRVPGLVLGAVLGWTFADLMLLRGQDAERPKPVVAAKKGEPPHLKPASKFTKFPDWVGAVALASDNKTLAAGSFEVVKLIDLSDSKELASLSTGGGMVQALAFSPDGKLLAVGGYQEATLWNVADKQKVRALEGHRGQVTSLSFSPDGSLLATGCEDETVRVFDTASGQAKQTLEGHLQPITGVAFFPDNLRLASVASDLTRSSKKGLLKVWNVAKGDELLSVEPHPKAVSSVAVSQDGKYIATTGHDETVNIFSADDAKVVLEYAEHERTINSVAFLPGGKFLATSSGGRNAGKNESHIWDIKGETKAVLEGHEAPVVQIIANGDGSRVITASRDKTVCVWDIAKIVGVEKPAAPAVVVAAPATTTKPEVQAQEPKPEVKELKAGIIGLDTSHAIAFTNLLNAENPKPELAGCKIVAAYPKGSPDIESSVSRVPGYIEEVKKKNVEIVDSIETLLTKVDVVFLETNDGRPHLEQALPCFKAKKPVFIDKPISASLTDAVALFDEAKKYSAPMFSSSSLRFSEGAQAIRKGKIGDVLGCDTYSPCSLEKTHPDLFWYGIHGVETLFTVMGPGCESVSRTSTENFDQATGVWKGGKIGTFRGIRTKEGSGYGGTAFGTKGIEPVGKYDGYEPLVVEIVKFFRTGQPPVTEEETLQIYAFMEAADESKRQGGAPVKLETVLAKAREEAKQKTGKLD